MYIYLGLIDLLYSRITKRRHIMTETTEQKGKSFLAALLLNFFLGFLGAHRFYTGYIGIGVLQLLTAGGLGIWALIDLIFISLGRYKDAQGRELEEYNKNIGLAVIIVLILLVLTSIFSNFG